MHKDTQKEYELICILPITLETDGLTSVKEKVTGLISKYKGVIIKEEDLGKKKLAYAIRLNRHGYYFLITFSLPTALANALSAEIKILPEIIRHSITVKEKTTAVTEPAADGGREKRDRTAEPLVAPTATSPEKTAAPKPHDVKVDIQELDRKIDELLSEHEV